LVHRQI